MMKKGEKLMYADLYIHTFGKRIHARMDNYPDMKVFHIIWDNSRVSIFLDDSNIKFFKETLLNALKDEPICECCESERKES